MIQGIANVGLNYAISELNLNPLVANLGASVIGSFLEAQISSSEGMTNKEKLMKAGELYGKRFEAILGGPQKPVKNLYDNVTYQTKLSEYSWKKSAHTQTILQVSSAIRENGIESALNSFATSIFNGIAVQTITNVAKISIDHIGTFVKERLDAFKANPTGTPDVTKDEETGELEIKIKNEKGEVIFKMTLKEMQEAGYSDYILTGHEMPRKYIVKQIYGLADEMYGQGYDKDGSYTVYIDDINGVDVSREDINKSVKFYHLDTGRVVTIDPVYDEAGLMITHYEVELNSAYSQFNTAPDTAVTYYFMEDELVGTDETLNLRIGSAATDRFYIEDVVVKHTNNNRIESLETIAMDKYDGWYYNKNTGEYYEVEYQIGAGGKITTVVDGKTISLGDVNTYITYAGPIQVELKNGATIPADGFGLDDLQDLTMTHFDISDETHRFIESVDAAVTRTDLECLPSSNKVGCMTVGSSTTEVDVSSLEIAETSGLEKSIMTIKNGVMTDFDWDSAVDPKKKIINLLVDSGKGGTIKTDNSINLAAVQENGREVRYGTEDSYLFIGNASPETLTNGAKYLETEREIKMGDLTYKIIAKSYVDADGGSMSMTSRTVTTIIRSDNTFAIIDNEVTSKLGQDFDIDGDTYGELYGKLSLKGAGLPTPVGKVLSEMYKDLCDFAGEMIK